MENYLTTQVCDNTSSVETCTTTLTGTSTLDIEKFQIYQNINFSFDIIFIFIVSWVVYTFLKHW